MLFVCFVATGLVDVDDDDVVILHIIHYTNI